jgi:hypothetical protein
VRESKTTRTFSLVVRHIKRKKLGFSLGRAFFFLGGGGGGGGGEWGGLQL